MTFGVATIEVKAIQSALLLSYNIKSSSIIVGITLKL
jgi:hypothetical protein